MSFRDIFWSKGQPWRGIRTWTVPRLLRLAHCTLMCTVRISTTGIHRCYVPFNDPNHEPTFFVLWHDQTFIPLHFFRRVGINVMMSTSRAGQMQAAFWRLYGWPTIWGSTKKRAGIVALRSMVRSLREGTVLGFTPDGPKGPRHHVHPGAIYLASKAPAVILPLAVASSRAWRLPTWDRFLIPKPFARVHIHMGEPVRVPSGLSREETEAWQLRLQDILNDVERIANLELAERMGR